MAVPVIQAFLFDLGRVLLHFDHHRGLAQVARLAGIPLPQVVALYGELDIQNRYEIGGLSTLDIIAELKKVPGCNDFGEGEFVAAAGDIFQPIAGTVQIAERLHRQGKKLCLVSNTCDVHMRHCLSQYDFFRLFPQRIFSHEVEVAKPNPKFYQLACNAVDEPPETCLFIDDLPENIAAARKFGMQGHLFVSSENLALDLENYAF